MRVINPNVLKQLKVEEILQDIPLVEHLTQPHTQKPHKCEHSERFETSVVNEGSSKHTAYNLEAYRISCRHCRDL